ncbi:MAG TPA: S9 family peptidase [Acidimicrobiales bacterium]|nr:S9 family peptidase [Acidimicrobiales bacterium]
MPSEHGLVAPYGSWSSPVTPELLVEQAVRLESATVSDGEVFWVESRPSEGGRQVLMAVPLADPDRPREITGADFSVRTQVHEYGGRCYAVHGDTVVFSNWADQRMWVTGRHGGPPRPITPEPDRARSDRFADPVIDPTGRWLVAVRERHLGDGQVVNDLVAVAVDGRSEPVPVASGHDFYSAPRLSPAGDRLAWISWDHPDMPWDATSLYAAPVDFGVDPPAVGPARQIAGGPQESVTQPRWSLDGVLHFVTDRWGWWNLFDETGRSLCTMAAEFASPDWVFGNAGYGFDPAGDVIASWSAPAGAGIGWMPRSGMGPNGGLQRMDLPFSSFSSVCPVEGGAVAIVASPTASPALARLDWSDGSVTVLRRSRPDRLDPAYISQPQAVEFPTGDRDQAHALFYPPNNPDFRAPDGERPPVLLILHGGPTSAASAVLNLSIQFWTTRGIAVADIDYRGSSGYGRAYRQKLSGAWGVADVEDCAAAVAWLDGQQLVDGRRALIRGGSSGGFTTLAALAFTGSFAAGASHFGIADLELLARDTHKFEARYLDSLVGPWPEKADEYRRRSPIHHTDAITSPLILFQGLDDAVVPPAQSQLMYDALERRGVPVCYLAFEGEQHGFRQAATIKRVVAAELDFYGRVLGFAPEPVADPPLVIANGERLSPRS